MAGLVIACKTTKDDTRIEEWWSSIQGSKSETLKRVILSYLDGGNNGGRSSRNGGDDSGGGNLAGVLEKLSDVLNRLDEKLDPDGTAENPTPRNLPRNGHNHKPKPAPKPAPVVIEEPPPDDEDTVAAATNNFLNAFQHA